MVAGAIAFVVYASIVSQVLMRYKPSALATTLTFLFAWLSTAFGLVCLVTLGRAA